MKSKKVLVRYGTLDFDRSANSEYRLTAIRSIWLETGSVKKYYDTTSYLIKLSKCARTVFEYAVDKMDKKNEFVNDKAFKNDFNELLENCGEKPYEAGTINKAFKELVDEDLIYQTKKKSAYIVNPVHYFAGTEEERKKFVRKWLERPFQRELAFSRKKMLDERDRKAKEKA